MDWSRKGTWKIFSRVVLGRVERVAVVRGQRLLQPAAVDPDYHEEVERQQQVDGLQHLGDLGVGAAVEVVDVEHDPLDAGARTGRCRRLGDERDEPLEVAAHPRDEPQLVEVVRAGRPFPDELEHLTVAVVGTALESGQFPPGGLLLRLGLRQPATHVVQLLPALRAALVDLLEDPDRAAEPRQQCRGHDADRGENRRQRRPVPDADDHGDDDQHADEDRGQSTVGHLRPQEGGGGARLPVTSSRAASASRTSSVWAVV
jgi:hypothetical protein